VTVIVSSDAAVPGEKGRAAARGGQGPLAF